MEDAILHEFVSGVPDNPTFNGAIQPSHWNEGHVLTGGSNGDIPVRDSTKPSGFSWSSIAAAVSGRVLNYQTVSQSLSNATLSPTGDLAFTNFTVSKAGSKNFIFIQASLTDSNTQPYRQGVLSVLVDNAAFVNLFINGAGVPLLFLNVSTFSVGSHNIKGRMASTVNPFSTTLWFYVLEIDI